MQPDESSVQTDMRPSTAFRVFEKSEIEQSIAQRLERQVTLFPSRMAVWTAHDQETYDDLNQRANRIAHTLVARRGSASEGVAIVFGQSVSLIAAILGILKA